MQVGDKVRVSLPDYSKHHKKTGKVVEQSTVFGNDKTAWRVKLDDPSGSFTGTVTFEEKELELLGRGGFTIGDKVTFTDSLCYHYPEGKSGSVIDFLRQTAFVQRTDGKTNEVPLANLSHAIDEPQPFPCESESAADYPHTDKFKVGDKVLITAERLKSHTTFEYLRGVVGTVNSLSFGGVYVTWPLACEQKAQSLRHVWWFVDSLERAIVGYNTLTIADDTLTGPGSRTENLFRRAVALKKAGYSFDATKDLLTTYNLTYIVPSLTQAEVNGVLANVYKLSRMFFADLSEIELRTLGHEFGLTKGDMFHAQMQQNLKIQSLEADLSVKKAEIESLKSALEGQKTETRRLSSNNLSLKSRMTAALGHLRG